MNPAQPPPGGFTSDSRSQCQFPNASFYKPYVYVVNDSATALDGQVTSSKLASDDNPFTHHSRDRNFFVYPDVPSQYLLATPGNFATGEPTEQGRIEVEWESAAMPAWALPMQGDRVHVEGAWIFDCAHDEGGYRTEIHAPVLVMSLRDAASAGWAGATSASGSRPGVADTMPGFGTTPVPITRADVFASSDGGQAPDATCKCRALDWTQAAMLASKSYDLFVPAPPRPSPDAQLISQLVPRPLPSCPSNDDCDEGRMYDLLQREPNRIHIDQSTDPNRPGYNIHIDLTGFGTAGFPSQLFGVGFTLKVAWNQPATPAPRRVKVTLKNVYVANPMDGSPPAACISFAEFCDGEFALSTIVGDQFKHLRLCCGSKDTDDNVHQDVPYSEEVNNYLYKVDGTSIYCGLASVGNPEDVHCQNTFQVTLLPGQPLRIYLRGDEWEPFTCCTVDDSTNKDVGVVEHIFTEAQNYGIDGSNIGTRGDYTEWFQDHTSAGDDNVNGYCTPPNGPCINVTYHIDDDPYPAPPTVAAATASAPSVVRSFTTFVTGASTITLSAAAPATRPADTVELHAHAWRIGTPIPAVTTCGTGTGPATCSLHLTANDGADGQYLIDYYAVDTTTGAISASRVAGFTLDNSPPVTVVNFGATPVRGWYNTLGPVSLTADDGTGVGVDHTTYALDDGADLLYIAPFSFAGDGAAHTLSYFSVDQLTNTEARHTATFKIDTTPPTLGATGSDGTFTYSQDELLAGLLTNSTSLTVSYTAGDALSGLYQVRLDGQILTATTGTFTVQLAPGITTHVLTAEDIAGNLTTVTFAVASISLVPGATPQGTGYWRSTVPAPQIAPYLQIADLASRAFGPPTNHYPDATLDNYQVLLTAGPTASRDAQLRAELLAAWLNVASGYLATTAPIDLSKVKNWQTIVTNTGGSPQTTALNLIREVERRLAANPTDAQLETAKNLLEALNLGKLSRQ
ncbi:MAG TPA: hypothetical protein VEK80_17655 [Kribbellaceae bacterium]|nr:hypothetical protein [Kribbellaceae bacterium]